MTSLPVCPPPLANSFQEAERSRPFPESRSLGLFCIVTIVETFSIELCQFISSLELVGLVNFPKFTEKLRGTIFAARCANLNENNTAGTEENTACQQTILRHIEFPSNMYVVPLHTAYISPNIQKLNDVKPNALRSMR